MIELREVRNDLGHYGITLTVDSELKLERIGNSRAECFRKLEEAINNEIADRQSWLQWVQFQRREAAE